MKAVFFLIMFFPISNAWSFEYSIDQATLLNPSPIQIYKIGKVFSASGYHSLSDVNLVDAGLPFDRVYVSHQWGAAITLKSGLRVPRAMRGVVLQDERLKVNVFHFEVENTPYMVMGLSMSSEEFREIVKPWVNKVDSAMKWGLFLNKSHAAPCMYGLKDNMTFVGQSFTDDSIMRAIGRCGTDALSGVKGNMTSTLSFFKRLATDPSGLWEETKTSFLQLKDFVLNIGDELRNTFNAIQSLPSEEKAAIACTLAGEALGGVAQMLVGFGAATQLAKMLPSLILKMKAALKTVKKVLELKSKGFKISNGSRFAREAMSCAL